MYLRFRFASQKRKAQKWQDLRSYCQEFCEAKLPRANRAAVCPAQGIEAEILLAERIAEPKDWSG
jgi:hypothetical protein